MVDSLFRSPAFILTESSFIFVALIAAYELLIGDSVVAQQKESRRVSLQSRGRGYDSFESRQTPHHGHRSLSPGGRRVRGPRGAPASQPGPNEESSLLYPQSRSRGVTGENRIAEEGYYSSPGDTRFASPGRGSTGDNTRRMVSHPYHNFFWKKVQTLPTIILILLPNATTCVVLQGHPPSTTIKIYLSPSRNILFVS